MTPGTAPHEPRQPLKRRTLLQLLGISTDTLRRRMADGKLPPPDIDFGGAHQWWRPDTLERAGIKLWAPEGGPASANPQTPATS